MPTISQRSESEAHPKAKSFRLTGAFLGWLGAVDSLITGVFIVTAVSELARFPNSEHLILQGNIAIVGTTFSSVALTYGSYLLWKGNLRRGGITNCASGIIFGFLYINFHFLVQPSLLAWLDPFGYFLVAPGLLSGSIGLLTPYI